MINLSLPLKIDGRNLSLPQIPCTLKICQVSKIAGKPFRSLFQRDY